MKLDDNQLRKITELIQIEADKRRSDAGYSGSHSDGGASNLEFQIEFYKAGVNRALPKEWEKYQHQLDPEYKDYIRLKKKFEN